VIVRVFLVAAALVVLALRGLAADGGSIVLKLENGKIEERQASTVPAQTVPTPTSPMPLSAVTAGPAPAIKAASAVLMDADTGQVIYAVEPHVRRPNASTTKIMTAILFIEKCPMDAIVKVKKDATSTPYTSLNLRPGEQICAKDLLIGMMVRSANDAAVVIAEHVAGSVRKFAKMMNRKAKALGCRNTHFVTPNGLYSKGHYSSAYDLCVITRYALRYPIFNEVIAIRKHVIDSRSINKKDLVVINRSKFLRDYEGADGVKSGYVKQAGHCYVGSATRGGWRLLSAVLKSDNASRDTATLMDYGFNHFEPVTVVAANEPCADVEVAGGLHQKVSVGTKADFRVVVPKLQRHVTTRFKFQPVTAPIEKGDRVGQVVAIVNGAAVATADLFALQDVSVCLGRRVWSWMGSAGVALICLFAGIRYGTALAKNPRQRRFGVATTLRGFDRFRQSGGQR
jgi:D-alanyl-D-alanine carboxypeptidase (penicillin-binding protein 5/6)